MESMSSVLGGVGLLLFGLDDDEESVAERTEVNGSASDEPSEDADGAEDGFARIVCVVGV